MASNDVARKTHSAPGAVPVRARHDGCPHDHAWQRRRLLTLVSTDGAPSGWRPSWRCLLPASVAASHAFGDLTQPGLDAGAV
jgi:hypothetical protein